MYQQLFLKPYQKQSFLKDYELLSTLVSLSCTDLFDVALNKIDQFWHTLYFRPHYNLNLQSISVNDQILAINPAIFATSSNQGTIVDSGTTLAYLAEAAYDPFVNAVSFTGKSL